MSSIEGFDAFQEQLEAQLLRPDNERPDMTSGSSPVRGVIEIGRVVGGAAQRALLGGEFVPNGRDLIINIEVGAPPLGAPLSQVRSFVHKELTAGLPNEFLRAVNEGLANGIKRTAVQVGSLTISIAAYHEVDSSEVVFSWVAEALAVALADLSQTGAVSLDRLEDVIRGW